MSSVLTSKSSDIISHDIFIRKLKKNYILLCDHIISKEAVQSVLFPVKMTRVLSEYALNLVLLHIFSNDIDSEIKTTLMKSLPKSATWMRIQKFISLKKHQTTKHHNSVMTKASSYFKWKKSWHKYKHKHV